MDLDALLEQYARGLMPTQRDELERRILVAQIGNLGWSLAGAPRGREMQALSRGGMWANQTARELREQDLMRQHGAMTGVREVTQLQQMRQQAADREAMRKAAALAQAGDWEGYQRAVAGIDPNVALQIDPKVREQGIRRALAGMPQGAPNAPAGPSGSPPAAPPPPAAMSMPPAPPAPASGPPAPPAGLPPVPPPVSQRVALLEQQAQQMILQSKALRAAGYIPEADQLATKAVELLSKLPKRAETRTYERPDGTRYDANIMDDASVVPIEGHTPKSGALSYQDAGGHISVRNDRGQEVGRIPKGLSPDAAKSLWAPTVNADTGQVLYPPGAKGGARAESIPGYTPTLKPSALSSDERKGLSETVGMLESLRTLQGSFKDGYAMAPYGPGAGTALTVTNRLGSWANKGDQSMARWWSDYEKMVNLPERFALFGASLTQGEKEAWNAARSVKPGADPGVIREALDAMGAIAASKVSGMRESLLVDGKKPDSVDAIINRSGGGLVGKPTSPPNDAPPKVGDVRVGDGGQRYRFKGGDRYNRANWEPVQ